MKMSRLRNFSTDYSFERLRDTLNNIEEVRQDVKESITSTKLSNEERVHRVIKGLFHMMVYVLELPFNKTKFEIKGYEMLGDMLVHFRSYKFALMYYMRGVLCGVTE